MTAAARFIVRGRVQGVAFRAHARAEALALGLRGHAVNRADGGVDVAAAGEPAALDAFARWLAQGPALARVDTVERLPAIAADIDEGSTSADGSPAGDAASPTLRAMHGIPIERAARGVAR